MLLPKFDFSEPRTLDEACRIMAELGDRARPLAGGTDLIVNMKKKLVSPEHLVSLARINDLQGIDFSDGRLKIGASVTAAELADSDYIRDGLIALGQGARSLGSPLIRNLATIAGNIVSARPAADLPPALIAYGAEAVLQSLAGERSLPLEEFFRGPGDTLVKADEILTRIVVDRPPENSGAAYIKLGTRKALEISLVNVAVYIRLDDPAGAIEDARVVLGAVAPTPIRAPSAEKVLVGQEPTGALFEKAGRQAAGESRPIDDFRGSAEYRRDMVAVLTRKALEMASGQVRR
jgi:carbon-monoxide dehydrogenase medium subunit